MNQNAVVPMKKPTLTEIMASRYDMDRDNFVKTIKATCMPSNASNEELAAFLMVANEHHLNPITREIYAFPKKGGGIQPIVGIDGWMTLINLHPQFDGMEFEDVHDKAGDLSAITCRIYRKDRNHPVAVTEYMEECKRPTEPWQKWPARMLRHKAAIQAARYAFAFAGIIDQEEAERSPDVITDAVQAPPPPSVEDQIETVEVQEGGTDAFTVSDILDRAWTDLANTETPEDLEDAWTEYAHLVETLSPEDAKRLTDLYDKRLQELEPNPLRGG